MTHNRSSIRVVLVGAATIALSACVDNPTASPISATGATAALSEGRGAFQRYVAIGTSISMGVAGDGATAESQSMSWPAQLTRMAEREMTLPLIAGPGCRSPLRAPLATGLRISGEGAGADPATLSCAPNVEGAEPPTQNLAVNAALTRDALFTTPENVTDPNNRLVYPRILPPGETQISALEKANPKIVSVEFGGNEVLGVRSGIAIPGATITPFASWAPLYTQLVDRVAAVTKYGILIGLIDDVAAFPGFRRGAELYADRFAFRAAFNVEVAADCDASDNLLFVPVRVPTAVATGAALRPRGVPATLSCTGGPPNAQDFVLTPDEAAIVNAQMAQMSAHIRAEAERLGFAYAELEALYGRSDIKAPFNVVQLMTSLQPYGTYVSLDGIHPSADGQRLIAEAAAAALDAKYGFGIATSALIASR